MNVPPRFQRFVVVFAGCLISCVAFGCAAAPATDAETAIGEVRARRLALQAEKIAALADLTTRVQQQVDAGRASDADALRARVAWLEARIEEQQMLLDGMK